MGWCTDKLLVELKSFKARLIILAVRGNLVWPLLTSLTVGEFYKLITGFLCPVKQENDKYNYPSQAALDDGFLDVRQGD